MLYAAGRWLFWLVLRYVFGARVEGAENFPPSGPVVFCANHISWWDPTLMAGAVTRQVNFMAKEELFRNRLAARVLRAVGAFPVRRGAPDRAALRHAQALLAGGQVLGMFPEGTRSKSGELQPGLHGAALLALRARAPVVPAAISGSYRPRGGLKIRVGHAFGLEETAVRSEAVEQGSRQIMTAIACLLQS